VVVKIADVGEAKALTNPTNTAGVGSALYRSAEGNSDRYTEKSDVFSMGISMCEVVARCLADREGQLLVDVSHFLVRRSDLVRDAVSRVGWRCAPLAAILQRCCAKVAGDRPDSDTVLRWLRALVEVYTLQVRTGAGVGAVDYDAWEAGPVLGSDRLVMGAAMAGAEGCQGLMHHAKLDGQDVCCKVR
jgi:hypothetical protein